MRALKKILFLGLFTALVLGGFGLLLRNPVLENNKVDRIFVGPSPEVLKAHVELLSSESRNFKTERLLELADYIQKQFISIDISTEMQSFLVDNREYKNVRAFVGSKQAPHRIVIGAHYDAFGETPGADDNASGVAGLIELARMLSTLYLALPQSKDVCFEFVAYTLEEPPFFRTDKMGSAVHAEALLNEGISPKLMVSLEMIGFFTDEENSQKFPNPLLNLYYPTKGSFIALVGQLREFAAIRKLKIGFMEVSDFPIISINAPFTIPGIDFSDHLNYWAKNWPAVMVTDTAFLRNPNYHTAEDTPDTLDYKKMSEVIKGVAGMLLNFAEQQ